MIYHFYAGAVDIMQQGLGMLCFFAAAARGVAGDQAVVGYLAHGAAIAPALPYHTALHALFRLPQGGEPAEAPSGDVLCTAVQGIQLDAAAASGIAAHEGAYGGVRLFPAVAAASPQIAAAALFIQPVQGRESAEALARQILLPTTAGDVLLPCAARHPENLLDHHIILLMW